MKKTFFKSKNYVLYNDMHDTRLRTSEYASILVRNNIPHSRINLYTEQLGIAVKGTVHREINVCSLYIPPDKIIDKRELNKLIAKLPKPFIKLGAPKWLSYYIGK